VYVLDEKQRAVPMGVAGELYIGGEGVGRGYLHLPEMTAERFIPDGFSEVGGGRLYRTGDVVRYGGDGVLEYEGRADNQVKVRGYRIELGEVEGALNEAAGVRESVVMVREEEGGNRSLVAYVVMREGGAEVAGRELRRVLREKLPEYMVPGRYIGVREMPLTPSGKVDRRALLLSESVRPAPVEDYDAPLTTVEELVANIWADVLGLEKVGSDDNFLELGGHSLLATQLVSRIRESFRIELPLRTIFDAPTLSVLALHIDAALRAARVLDAPAIEPIGRDQPLPLSFAQQRLWFLHQLDPLSPAYNIITAIALNGSLDLSALQRSLAHLISRHESLRTIFPMHEGRAVQQIVAAGVWELEVEELSPEAESERGEQVSRRVSAEASEPFELERGPLVRVKLLRLSASEHVLVVVMHHIISDGWSLGVLRREVAELYEGYVGGEEVELEELRVQYADYAVWQRGWLRGEVLEQQLEYWKHQLRGALPSAPLTTDFPRLQTTTPIGAYEPFVIPANLTQALRTLSAHEDVTLFMSLLAAFQTLLYRYTANEDIIVGAPIANRNRKETEGLIGFFMNMLIYRTSFSGTPTFRQLLRRVRERAMEAYAYQDVPFEKLVDELQPERDPDNKPLIQVVFSLQNAPPPPSVSRTGLSMRMLDLNIGSSMFDLTLMLNDTGRGGLHGGLNYNAGLFHETTIKWILGHFMKVLETVVKEPDLPLIEIPFQSYQENHMFNNPAQLVNGFGTEQFNF
jgi:acyl carrier protein